MRFPLSLGDVRLEITPSPTNWVTTWGPHTTTIMDRGAYAHSFGIQLPEAGVRSIMAYSCPHHSLPAVEPLVQSRPVLGREPAWRIRLWTRCSRQPTLSESNCTHRRSLSGQCRHRGTHSTRHTIPHSWIDTPSSSVSFVLSDVTADQYVVTVGNTIGGTDLGRFDFRARTTGLVDGLPTDGRTLFVRAWARHGDTWHHTDHTYSAHTEETIDTELPEMVSPVPGSMLSKSTITFSWTESNATQVVVRIGRSLTMPHWVSTE